MKSDWFDQEADVNDARVPPRVVALQRLYNIVANLAHPHGDCREHPLEDEAHDIIRELLTGRL